MNEPLSNCTAFLQWALPRLHLRWGGYRKVRKQACKRIRRRIRGLGLDGYEAYRDYLHKHPGEWEQLDAFCRITISRFYRDRGVFELISSSILPSLAEQALNEHATLRCWSAGCASGEEPYTLAIIWRLLLKPCFPDTAFEIIATDADAQLLERARQAHYPAGSLKELPAEWKAEAFIRQDEQFQLHPEFTRTVRFLQQDIRKEQPAGPFQLVLCRNLVAMYFEEELQREVFTKIREAMASGGYLVLGKHRRLPEGMNGFEEWDAHNRIYRKA